MLRGVGRLADGSGGVRGERGREFTAIQRVHAGANDINARARMQPAPLSGISSKVRPRFEEDMRVNNKTTKARLAPVAIGLALIGANVARAQRGTGDWMTAAFDAQRSSWVRVDGKIAVETMSKPGFTLDWKTKFNNTPRQLNALTPPALLDFYIGYRGFRALGFFGGSADRVIGLDTDIARLEWEKALATPGKAGTIPCPGGMTSSVTRPLGLAYPTVLGGRGFGRGTPAKSGVGEANEGAVTLRNAPPPAARPTPPPKPAPGAAAAAAANPFAPRVQYVLALTSDGKLHMMWVSNGHEANPAVPFLPPNAHAVGLIAFDNTAYVATVNGCGGVDNGIWALDLVSKKVTAWKNGSIAGNVGPAVGPDGALYVAAAGGELVALAPGTLAVKASNKTGGAEFSSSPVVFERKGGGNMVAVATGDGGLAVWDAGNINGGPVAKSAAFGRAGYKAGSVTSWQDAGGTRWILVAAGGPANGIQNGAVVALKLVERGGGFALEPGWVSRDLVSPLAPIVVNGVVFALSSGEYRSDDASMTAAQRAAKSGKAVLHALDGATGKELWNSGDTMTSFTSSGGLAAGGSRVYVSTFDGMQYAFSFPIEH